MPPASDRARGWRRRHRLSMRSQHIKATPRAFGAQPNATRLGRGSSGVGLGSGLQRGATLLAIQRHDRGRRRASRLTSVIRTIRRPLVGRRCARHAKSIGPLPSGCTDVGNEYDLPRGRRDGSSSACPRNSGPRAPDSNQPVTVEQAAPSRFRIPASSSFEAYSVTRVRRGSSIHSTSGRSSTLTQETTTNFGQLLSKLIGCDVRSDRHPLLGVDPPDVEAFLQPHHVDTGLGVTAKGLRARQAPLRATAAAASSARLTIGMTLRRCGLIIRP